MRVARVMSVMALTLVLVVSLTGCSLIRDRLVTPDPPNRELQREAALVYREEWQPDVEKIRFTQEGNRPGLGASWRANAVVTVGSVEYEVIIGPDIGPAFVGESGMPPKSPTPAPSTRLTVIYSDGTSEVIR